jgi:hypothetical protein
MKIFISYSTALDQILALRLQTMASVYGVTSYVPPAWTREQSTDAPDVLRNLRESDVVLAVITHVPATSAVTEMNFATQWRKLLIPIVTDNVAPENYLQFAPFFLVDRQDPSKTEKAIVQFLAQKQQAEVGKTALLALATLALALILFGPDSQS